MGKGHIKAVSKEEIKMANIYIEKFAYGEMQTEQQWGTIWTCHSRKGCEERALWSIAVGGVYRLSLQLDSSM